MSDATPAVISHRTAHYRALADEAIASAPPFPADRFAGRGIVICASGLRYFVCAWICVRMLQRLGCTLPIEFWALGEHDWTPEMERLAREELGVGDCRLPRAEDRARFTDMWAESAGRAGWELKPYSIVESRFREVLLLDADIVPVADPTFLFDSPQLAEHGAIFWPDPTLARCNAAVRLPLAPGVNRTVNVVLPPGTTGAAGLAITLKSPAFAPSIVTPRPVRFAAPVFRIVTVGFVPVPTTPAPKFTVLTPSVRLVPTGCSTTISAGKIAVSWSRWFCRASRVPPWKTSAPAKPRWSR